MTDTADPTTAETPPKRGRGRPPGSYGKYRPRLPEELKAPDELNPLVQELNRELKEREFIDGLPQKNSDRRSGVGKTGFLKNAR